MATMPDTRTYEDFDPASEWTREEEAFTTLLVHLPGFKKDQLKLQVDAKGNLRMTGVRPLDGQRWLRFIKDFRIPENCTSTAGIRARFENETLHVRFPIVVVQPPADALPQPPSQEATTKTTAPPPPQIAAATTTASEREMTQKANGKSTETAGRALTEEKSQGNGKSTATTAPPPPQMAAATTTASERDEMTQKANGKSTETAGRTLTQEKPQANGKSTVTREESEKKKEEIMKLTQPKEEVAGKEKIDQEGISKKPEQQMISKNKTGDDKSSDEQKTAQPSSPTPDGDDRGIDRVREEMKMHGVGGILTARLLTPARKVLLANAAVASLVLLGLVVYFKYK